MEDWVRRCPAQFGEVEDYPIKCLNPYRQQFIVNSLLTSMSGVHMVVPGDVTAVGNTFSAFVDANDCPIQTISTAAPR